MADEGSTDRTGRAIANPDRDLLVVHSPSVYDITRSSTITPVGAIKRLKKERDRDPFLTAPAPNTNHIFLENKPLSDCDRNPIANPV